MPAVPWSEEHPLVQWACRLPRDFHFFQLLHLIQRSDPERPPVGHQGPVPKEPIRMRPALSLAFPPYDIDTCEWEPSTESHWGRLLLSLTFLGLYGVDSPLPTHFTERLLPEQEEDELVRGFLDLFHHRTYSLLYRGWAKYRYHVSFQRGGVDPISQVVRAFLGINTPKTAEQLHEPPVRLFRYAGLVLQRPRSASGLAGLLRDFFDGVPVEIEQCVGRWLPIQLDDRNRVGRRKCSLGMDFLLGERIYDRSGKFRVRVGPLGFDQYTDFLPPGRARAQLDELVRFYCEDALQFDVEAILREDEVPELPLGERGMLGRLSWTTWLKSKPSGDKSVVFPPGQ